MDGQWENRAVWNLTLFNTTNVERTMPGNLASIYTYHPVVPSPAGTGNGDLRLSKITHRIAAGAVFDEQGYDYDAAGNISGWKQHPGVITATNGALWSFGYDAADQLLGATQQGTVNGVPGGSVTEQDRYDYDAAGNRKVEQRAVLQGASYVTTLASDTHNALNQVTARSGAGKMVFEGTVSEPAQVSVGGTAAQVWGIAGGQYGYRGTATVQSGANSVPIKATDANGNLRSATAQVTVSGAAQAFGYDANGNLTGDGTWSYTWDAANRLISASRTGALWEWTYNGRGQRVEEKLNSVVQWKLRWCGLELKVMAKPDGSDTRRFFAQGLLRTTVVSGQTSSLAYFLFRDHLGSVREVTDAAGTLQKRFAYDPWGRRTETLNTAGSFDPLVGFTGHYVHAATGLHFAFYRAYSADLGRWLSRDPIEEEGGPNLYNYVGNDPVDWIDPLGLKRCAKRVKLTHFGDLKSDKVGTRDNVLKPGDIAVGHYGEGQHPKKGEKWVLPFGTKAKVSPDNSDEFDATVADVGAYDKKHPDKAGPADWIDIWDPDKSKKGKSDKGWIEAEVKDECPCPKGYKEVRKALPVN